MSWIIKTFLGLSTDADADNLNQLRANLELLKLHTHTGEAGDGGIIGAGLEYVQRIAFFSSENSGWDTTVTLAVFMGGYLSTDDNLVGHTCSFEFPLKSGTWRLDIVHLKGTTFGIATIDYGGTVLGTIDFYNGSSTYNQESALTGLTIPALDIGSPALLTFSMLTKNASSGGYGAGLQFISMRRTGA